MFFKLIFCLITYLGFSILNATECMWWQTKVQSHEVKTHERNKNKVESYHRKEHCREKWRGGDKFASQFLSQKPKNWNSSEDILKWNEKEAQQLTEVLNQLPDWINLSSIMFYRAKKSVFPKNPASTNRSENYIVLYDVFFSKTNQKEILAHEISHTELLVLNNFELEEFSILSGWSYKIVKGRVYEIPPKKLIQSDSSVDKEEDFSNYFGLFITNPEKVKKHNFKIYEFLKKRYEK
jgi:hypothetical protein